MRIEDLIYRDKRDRLPGRLLLEGWRGLNDVTQADLAERLGVAQGTLSDVCRGNRTSRPILEAIEEETGIPVEAWER